MQLCVDIGNTSTVYAIFENRKKISSGMISSGSEWFKEISAFNIACCAISNVAEENRIPDELSSFDSILVDHKTPLPIQIEYETPETLGSDRICAAVGGHSLYPEKPVLTIDLGTCIKYELITEAGTYLGGNIAPGLSMRFRSLNSGTANLPLVSVGKVKRNMGQSTEEAIRNGVQLGMICEIEAMIDRLRPLYPNLVTVMTGGDLPHFENALKTPIFAHPLLVLQGLNEILLFNQSLES